MNPFLEALMSPFTTNQRTRDAFVPSRTGPMEETFYGRPPSWIQEGYGGAPDPALRGSLYGDPRSPGETRGALYNALQSPGQARGYSPGMNMPAPTAKWPY